MVRKVSISKEIATGVLSSMTSGMSESTKFRISKKADGLIIRRQILSTYRFTLPACSLSKRLTW